MINTKILCQQQKNKIGFFGVLIVISVIVFIGVNVTIVATNIATQNRIVEKKSDIGAKRSEATKIKKTISAIEQYKVKKNLNEKYGFYTSIDKQDFISSIISKMNNEDNIDFLENEQENKINLEYSGFLIRLNPLSNSKLEKLFTKLKRQFIVSNEQKVDATIDSSTIRVDFNADYEYVVYRMIKLFDKIMPGYLIVKSISIVPVNEDVKRMLYDMKFKNKQINNQYNLNDRLSCTIEMEWIFLKGTKPVE